MHQLVVFSPGAEEYGLQFVSDALVAHGVPVVCQGRSIEVHVANGDVLVRAVGTEPRKL